MAFIPLQIQKSVNWGIINRELSIQISYCGYGRGGWNQKGWKERETGSYNMKIVVIKYFKEKSRKHTQGTYRLSMYLHIYDCICKDE